jgi:hypothetical protein
MAEGDVMVTLPAKEHATLIVISSGILKHLTLSPLANAILTTPGDGDVAANDVALEVSFLICAIFTPSCSVAISISSETPKEPAQLLLSAIEE